MLPRHSTTTLLAALLLACAGPDAARAQTSLRTQRVVTGVTKPLFVTHPPGDFHRIFIVEQSGRIKILKNGQILAPEFLNVDPISGCCNERGLLGLAFHPNYATNGYFYINYTTVASPGSTVIARYSVSAANPDIADPVGTIVMTFPQPQANHNGGWLAFGGDGYLYIATGDGGGHFDSELDGHSVGGNAQDVTSKLLGKLLRVDVDGDDFPADALRNYAIPPDNPFVGMEGDDEIWAYGLRNPWRCAFDRAADDLYIADVGEESWEELNFQPAGDTGGRNYGWRCMEGNSCTTLTGCICNDPALTLPIYEYAHSASPPRCSITGGEVYRGCAIPDWGGTYFFADYCSAEIWSLRHDVINGVTDFTDRTAELAPGGVETIRDISSFGLDAAGEMYICDLNGGEVFKIVPDITLTITQSEPPIDAIDARRPIDQVTGEPVGWDGARITFDPTPACLTPLDIVVVQQGDLSAPPFATDITIGPDNVALVDLNRVIAPRAWTTIRHDVTATSVRFASLPADVNADRSSNESDVAALISTLNGLGDPRSESSTDIDRSALTTPADLLETVDLLNGAGLYDIFNGATLP